MSDDKDPKDKKDFMEQFMRLRKRISDLEEDKKKKDELLLQYDGMFKEFKDLLGKKGEDKKNDPAPEPTEKGFLDWLFE